MFPLMRILDGAVAMENKVKIELYNPATLPGIYSKELKAGS